MKLLPFGVDFSVTKEGARVILNKPTGSEIIALIIIIISITIWLKMYFNHKQILEYIKKNDEPKT